MNHRRYNKKWPEHKVLKEQITNSILHLKTKLNKDNGLVHNKGPWSKIKTWLSSRTRDGTLEWLNSVPYSAQTKCYGGGAQMISYSLSGIIRRGGRAVTLIEWNPSERPH